MQTTGQELGHHDLTNVWLIKNSIDITLFKAATRQPSVFKCEGPVRLHDKPFMSAISCSHSVISNDFNKKTKNIENQENKKISSEMEVALRYELFVDTA